MRWYWCYPQASLHLILGKYIFTVPGIFFRGTSPVQVVLFVNIFPSYFARTTRVDAGLNTVSSRHTTDNR